MQLPVSCCCCLRWLTCASRLQLLLHPHLLTRHADYPSHPRRLAGTPPLIRCLRDDLQPSSQGLLSSLATASRFWLQLTLVAVAWLGVVPLTAYRIYKCLFSGSASAIFSLPLDLLSTGEATASSRVTGASSRLLFLVSREHCLGCLLRLLRRDLHPLFLHLTSLVEGTDLARRS